jgi:hypothetical protein
MKKHTHTQYEPIDIRTNFSLHHNLHIMINLRNCYGYNLRFWGIDEILCLYSLFDIEAGHIIPFGLWNVLKTQLSFSHRLQITSKISSPPPPILEVLNPIQVLLWFQHVISDQY